MLPTVNCRKSQWRIMVKAWARNLSSGQSARRVVTTWIAKVALGLLDAANTENMGSGYPRHRSHNVTNLRFGVGLKAEQRPLTKTGSILRMLNGLNRARRFLTRKKKVRL